MQITTNTSITISVNGLNYSFTDQHPIVDLIAQLNMSTFDLSELETRTADKRALVADLQSQIQALCTTPV